ncbi:MAG: hypothetical protein R3288_10950 [Woeseiaceae bacterium]|nr:hypothetical protein [Woeseiaceae bacterium]
MHYLLPVLVMLASPALAGECDTQLDDVMDGYVAARGGAEALERQSALRIRSRLYEGEYQPEFDYRVMKPGYMWIRATYRDGFVYTEGFDGRRGWEKPGDEPARYVGGDAGKALNQGARSPVHLYGLNHMAELGARVSLTGCRTIDDTRYFVINVVSRFGTDIDYFVNAATYRLERSRSVRPLHPTQDPTRITIEERWSDFRPVNGVLHPFAYSQWNVDSGEQLSRLEIHDIADLPDATVADFAKP